MIEVVMTHDWRQRLNHNEVLCNVRLLQRLREAGVPVIGTISVIGVAYGKLTVEVDRDLNDNDDYIWRFEGEIRRPAPQPQQDDEL